MEQNLLLLCRLKYLSRKYKKTIEYRHGLETKPLAKWGFLAILIVTSGSSCYQIVQKHGGKIEVISQSEYGTEFTIILPTKISQ